MRGSSMPPRSVAGPVSGAALRGRRSSPPKLCARSRMADRSARILLVDDEQSIQTLLSYPLRKDGYDVVRATDGREALDRFSEQAFDLVVLDVMLPQLYGLDVCRRLRARSTLLDLMSLNKSDADE